MLKLQVLHGFDSMVRDTDEDLGEGTVGVLSLLSCESLAHCVLPVHGEASVRSLASVKNKADFLEIVESGDVLGLCNSKVSRW